MDLGIEGRVALVAGASKGLGQAVAFGLEGTTGESSDGFPGVCLRLSVA